MTTLVLGASALAASHCNRAADGSRYLTELPPGGGHASDAGMIDVAGESARTDADRFIDDLKAHYMIEPDSRAVRRGNRMDLPKEKYSLVPDSIASAIVPDGGQLKPSFSPATSDLPGVTRVTLAARADGSFEVREVASGLAVAARIVGARPVSSELSEGYVLYRDALPNGTHLVQLPMRTGTEDLIFIDHAETTSVSYDIVLGDKVAGLRLFSETLEMLDAGGMPRLRVSPPFLIDSSLKRHPVTLALSGCVADTSTAPPWSHPVLAPGGRSCRLTVAWKANEVTYPVFLDPSWNSAASLAVPRGSHFSGLLSDGTVLVAGGFTATYVNPVFVASAERFQPEPNGSGAWAAAAPMAGPRGWGYSVVRQGRLYAVEGASDFCTNLNTIEYFNPATSTWVMTSLPSMNPPRGSAWDGAAVLLLDGRILVAGGTESPDCGVTPWTPRAVTDIYDPETDHWTRGPDMPGTRAAHTMVTVSDGRALVVGGEDFIEDWSGVTMTYLNSTFLYNPSQNQWVSGPTLNHRRMYHATVSLSTTTPDVLVFGGIEQYPDTPTYGTVERWTGSTFQDVTPGMVTPRQWNYHIGWARRADGSVIAVASYGLGIGYLKDADIMNPSTATWSSTGMISSAMPPFFFNVTPLGSSGQVLVAGGVAGAPSWNAVTSAFTFTPPSAGDGGTDADSSPPPPPVSQFCGDGIRDPLLEECDRGETHPARATCSTDCRVNDLLAVADQAVADPPKRRILGEGRHPLATSPGGGFAVAFVEPDSSPLRLGLSTVDAGGLPSDTAISISAGSTPLHMSHPVVAGVPGNKYAVAYTDFDGDGDELGIAIRLVDPMSPPTGKPAHANTTTKFSQYDADLIATANGLVAAWVDDSVVANGPDIRYRTFSFGLSPTSDEQVLAGTASNEGDVALAPFGSGWAAAWRAGDAGTETLHVMSGSVHWTVGPFSPGPVGDRPALAEIDASHLLVVYTEGVDLDDAGMANASKLRAAVLDTSQQGSVTTAVDVATTVSAGSGHRLSQSHPNAARTGNDIYIAWRTEGALADPYGEELWLKSVSFSPGPTVDWSAPERPLPRRVIHRKGDQRHPAFAVGSTLTGAELVTAYDDLGRTFDPAGKEVVAIEAIPTPIVRTGEVSCAGQPDNAPCTGGTVCDGPQTCRSERCIAIAAPLECADGNRCTIDTCDPTLGCRHELPNTPCVPFDAPHRLAATITANESASGYPAANAGDESTTTQWIANLTTQTSNNVAWIQLDFGARKQVDRLRWTAATGTPSPAEHPSDYVVETSNDAYIWSPVTTRITAGVVEGSEFVGRIARYVRLKTTKVFDGSGSALSFFEIWGEGVDYQPGDVLRWQLFDDFDQPLSTDRWLVQQGNPQVANGSLTVDTASSALVMLSKSSFRDHLVHIKNFRETGGGRCWFMGLVDPNLQTGVVMRRDLNETYVEASIQDHLFVHVVASPPQFTDLGTFGPGQGLDMTYGWYGNTVHVDASKDGASLTHREISAALLPQQIRLGMASYCAVAFAVDEVFASPP